MHRTRRTAALLAAFSALALTGCTADSDGGAAGAADEFLVVATTTQVADFTRNIVDGVDGIAVSQLIESNQSAHGYDPSAGDLTELARADVLVVNGAGLEEWLDDVISASWFNGTIVDSSAALDAHAEADDAGHDDTDEPHGDDHDSDPAHDHGDEADGDAHAHDGDAHAHDGADPHIWTDVHNAAVMVDTIAAGLAEAGPDFADAVAANASAYRGALDDLDAWIRSNVDAVPTSERLLVSNHDALGYFTAAYGITYVGAVVPSFDDNAEPSAAEIDELVADIRRTGTRAVFSEASLSAKTAETIASEADVVVYSGEGALYVDSLGPAGSPGDTYIRAQVHNATRILHSWGVTASALPARLANGAR